MKRTNRKSYLFIYTIARYLTLGLVICSHLLLVQCGVKTKDVDRVAVYCSSMEGDRLERKADLVFRDDRETDLPEINIHPGILYQKIDGFGASFNEAGMICLNSLDAAAADTVLRNLFDPENGAGYTLMKSPIAACDFASAGPWYSYNDVPGDTGMNNFSIERDLGPNGLVTYIKRATGFGSFRIESPMDFAPDWMYYALEPGKKHIRPEYYRALAKYYARFIQAYEEQGITIDYLNLFNEADMPHYSNVTYKTMGRMIKDYVVPEFDARGITTKIQFGEACDRPEALEKFPPVLEDPEIREHISGLTFHGYTWGDYEACRELNTLFPDLPLWMTEVCYAEFCCIPEGGPDQCPVYDFSDGEYWGNVIMNDLRNQVSGWIYWNMILDQNGGPWLSSPVHGDPDPNRQHPVVIINRETGEVHYTGLYYYLAHFSKFVRPGASRIGSSCESSSLNQAAFLNTDGAFVLNIINNGEETGCAVRQGDKEIDLKLKSHSITTLIWNMS